MYPIATAQTLFIADNEISPGILLTVVGMMVTALGALGTSVLAYLSGKDRLKFDTKTQLLESKIESLEIAMVECNKDRKDIRATMVDIQGRAEKAEQKASKLEGERAANEIMISDLRHEVNDLRDRLYGNSIPKKTT